MQVVSRKLRIGILPATVPLMIRWEELPTAVSQRNGGVGGPHFRPYAPPSLRGYVRIPIELTSLKPEAARSLFPRLIDRNNDFWCLPKPTRLDARQEFRQGPEYRPACVHPCPGGEAAPRVVCLHRIRTCGLLRCGPGPQGHSVLESHVVHNHESPDVAGRQRQLGPRPMKERSGWNG